MNHDGLSSDNQKVMDVSRPGKGKIISTSRPVIAPLVSDDNSEVVKDVDSDLNEHRATGSQRVIEPISNSDEAAEQQEENQEKDATYESEENIGQKDNSNDETEPVSEEEFSKDSPQAKPEVSDAAEVDALASKVEAKKQAAKEAKEKAERDIRLQEMIESKQYVVPIKHSRTSLSLGLIVGIILILLIAAASIAGYLLLNS